MNNHPSQNRNVFLRAAFTAILAIPMTFSCSSATSQDKVKPGTKFLISCSDAKAIRHHYFTDTGDISERGPVLLPKGMSCGAAEDLDEKGMLKLQRDGEWMAYYKGTTTVLWRGVFKKNKREGQLLYFDTKGNKSKMIMYAGGEKEGPEEGYFSSGSTRYRGQNAEGMKTGQWEERGSEKSDCVTRGTYTKDEKTGAWEECEMEEATEKWYVGFRGSYAHGLRDGPAEIFHAGGELLGKGSFRADLVCKGSPPPEGVDACGRRTGHWVIYHSNGKLAAEGDYDGASGKRRGTWTEYYASGEKMGMGMRNHVRDGIWTFYAKSGDIAGQFSFKGNDFMASYCMVFEGGVKREEGQCSNVLIKYEVKEDQLKIGNIMRTGEWKGYHASGTKAWEGTFMMKIKMGPWKYYNESGGIESQGTYNMNKKTGMWKETQNGRLIQVEYDDFGRPKKK